MTRRIGCIGMLAGLLLLLGAFWLVQSWGGSGPAKTNVTVVIPGGATLTSASRELEKAGAIRSARMFVFLSKIFGGDEPIKAGEYRVLAHLSQSDVLKLLQGGQTVQKMVTIPEGRASVEVYDLVMAAPKLGGPLTVPAEGSILPDTYAYAPGDTRAGLVARMQKAMSDYLAKAWERRKPGLAVTTPQEAVTLASIVEKETGKDSERRMVAAVYSNRLKRGIPLQADPTFIYLITKGRPLGRRPFLSEVHAKNAYNTYEMTGLPIGPITNPGRASIDAVLDPAPSNALYFVADGTGGHVFADTLEQHNANVARWRAIRHARGDLGY